MKTHRAIPHHRVAIIGSGFSGLAMAIALRNAGIDFVVFERADDIGGAWRDNTYPGAACDVQSALYSYSFAPNPHWSRAYATQPEIHSYLRDVADRYGVRRHVRTDSEMLSAAWDDERNRWQLSTAGGQVSADILVSATGTLSDPAVPAIDGIENYTGALFHSARWDHTVDLTGKNVAVIGTGASAIQFVPAIQPITGSLSVFQRTPAWVIPRHDGPRSPRLQRLFAAAPVTERALRGFYYLTRELMVPGLTRYPRLISPLQAIARRHLATQVRDRDLREKLTPTFAMGCKRILISNTWYPALAQPNVDVVTDSITSLTENAVVTADGTHHRADVVILGTGFQATEPPVSHRILGRDGQSLAARWAGSMNAHKCTTVTGFPNFFILNGPNLGVGHTSMVYMIESQVRYILSALQRMDVAEVATIEVRARSQAQFVEALRRRDHDSVWTTGGCASWYLDANGHNTTMWPGSTLAFRRLTSALDWHNYHLDRSTSFSTTAVATLGHVEQRHR